MPGSWQQVGPAARQAESEMIPRGRVDRRDAASHRVCPDVRGRRAGESVFRVRYDEASGCEVYDRRFTCEVRATAKAI
jgi:hypothetical protein